MRVIEIILSEKREPHPEDISYLGKFIFDRDDVLNMIEQLIAYNNPAIIYQAAYNLAQLFLVVYNNEKDKLVVCQNKIFKYTTILLWTIQLIIDYLNTKQNKTYTGITALITFGSTECNALLNRIFPKPLIKKIDMGKNSNEWKPETWKEFFHLLRQEYNTVTEQWNNECRRELKESLRKAAIDYLKVKYEANGEKIMWNYEEFKVEYKYLENKCKVGKYYVKDLIKKNDGEIVYFAENVTKPCQFCSVNICVI